MTRADLEAAAKEKYPDTFGTDRHPWWVARERAAYIQGRLDQAEEDAQIAEHLRDIGWHKTIGHAIAAMIRKRVLG
jgi:hypothetical protein